MPQPVNPRTALPAVTVAAGALALTGCTGHWDVHAQITPSPETDETQLAASTATASSVRAHPGDGAPARPATAISDTVDFGDPVPFYGAPSTVTTVGLFGELDDQPRPAAGRFDGAANLAQITSATEGASFDPDLDRHGETLVFASTQHRQTSDVYLKSVHGRTMTQITNDPADDVMPAFAPDAKRIAFASNRSGNWDIFCTNVNGDPPVQLTFDDAEELDPTWSPDGSMIAYCKLGAQSGRWEIWVVDVEDSAAPRFLEYGVFPQWNPDPARSKIAFQRARERGSRLFSVWTVDFINGEAMHPTEIVSAANAAAMHPAWSPDGNRLVFVAVVEPDRQPLPRPSEADVWIVDLDGTHRTNLTNGKFLNLYPTWGADGSVYFLSDRSGVDNIWAAATDRALIGEPTADLPMVTADPAHQAPTEAP